MKPIIIFDLDGTLVDLWPIERRTLEAVIQNKLLENRVISGRLNRIKKSGENSLWKIYKITCKTFRVDAISRKKEFLTRYDYSQKRLIRSGGYSCPQVYFRSSDLRKLATNYQLALVTGSNEQEAKFVLREAGVDTLFKDALLMTRDKIKFSKVTGMPFKRIAKFGENGAIVIGDGTSDKIGARKAGLPFLDVREIRTEGVLDYLLTLKKIAEVF